jgi:hypothetical protein
MIYLVLVFEIHQLCPWNSPINSKTATNRVNIDFVFRLSQQICLFHTHTHTPHTHRKGGREGEILRDRFERRVDLIVIVVVEKVVMISIYACQHKGTFFFYLLRTKTIG